MTVLTVSWNSLPYLQGLVATVRHTSSADTRILVVDNASADDTRAYLRGRDDLRSVRLPTNVGHGAALDIGAALVDTEYLAVLDVDSFPISRDWLAHSVSLLDGEVRIAGARLHRNFVHPCFLVTRTQMLHELALTFRPVGSLARRATRAPLFLDVGEAMSQRILVKFGGGKALHFFEITSSQGADNAGAVFGDLVYHNQYATQGSGRDAAMTAYRAALREHHPNLEVS